jgi:hypothetical protein
MRLLSMLIWCVLSLGSTALLAENSLCQQHHCLGIVDVGSTGSRLHLYVYDKDTENNPIQIEEKWSTKVSPGFSSLELQQSSIDAYLNALFANQTESGVPVYFYATAGMRLLPAAKQKAYYEAVETWFAKQSAWTLMEAKTISGRDEGVLGWLSVNYQLGTLTGDDEASVGVMDMGGASVQVVFPMKNDAPGSANEVVHLVLYGKPLTLFSYSVLGVGKTLLNQQFLNHAACFPTDYSLPNGLKGQGDADACQEEVTHLLNDVHHVALGVKPQLQVTPPKTWYVMGGLAYLFQSPLFHLDQNQMTSQSLLEQANTMACQASWSALEQSYMNDESLFSTCLNASYYYALMVQGYGLSPNESIHLVPGEGADWTLGAILHQP